MKNLFFAALSVAETDKELEMPLIEELWRYFYNTYINPSEYYENLGADSGTMLSVRLMILGLFIGVSIAVFAAVFNKRVLGDAVRRILSRDATSPDKALTLEELGYSSNFVVGLAVRKSVSLRRVVKCREEMAYDQKLEEKRSAYEERRKNGEKLPKFREFPYKINIATDGFFIPEEQRYMAERKFDKKGTTWLGAVIAVIVMAVVFVALMVALPHIFELLDDVAGSIGSSNNSKIL